MIHFGARSFSDLESQRAINAALSNTCVSLHRRTGVDLLPVVSSPTYAKAYLTGIIGPRAFNR